MPKTLNISRDKAKRWEADMPNTAWISIFEPDDQKTIISNPILDKLPKIKIGFFDHREGFVGAPTPKDARRLVNFIEEHKEKSFVINCAAGISRSGAICKFLNKIYGHEWPEEYKEEAVPNKYLYELLVQAHATKSDSKWIKNWFSNMIPFEDPLEYEGVTYHAPENFYQAMKIPDEQFQLRQQIAKMTPHEAKRFVRTVKVLPWTNADRILFMNYALRWKFRLDTVWGQKLLETGNEEIVEWNNWSDFWWGKDVETKKGENNLGKLLMQIRNDLLMQKMLLDCSK